MPLIPSFVRLLHVPLLHSMLLVGWNETLVGGVVGSFMMETPNEFFPPRDVDWRAERKQHIIVTTDIVSRSRRDLFRLFLGFLVPHRMFSQTTRHPKRRPCVSFSSSVCSLERPNHPSTDRIASHQSHRYEPTNPNELCVH